MLTDSHNLPDPRIVVALDYDNSDQALDFVKKIDPKLCRLKVGKEMFTYFGPSFVKQLIALGFDVFLDLKFHDIPNTVAKAVAAAADMGVWMVNVHASGGQEMMEKSYQALSSFGSDRPLLIAVTVLTSMSQPQLNQLGVAGELSDQVINLAGLTHDSQLDGVVCSAQEANLLKSKFGEDFKLVTPGIRPANADSDDQKRIVTPQQAIKNGSDYLVIGRPITKASDPLKALCDISDSIGDLL
ncbi:MAG: orotidine-5'-phosphate decarboxylase [Kangiellaceae bacterium]|jgi:orotidine-5'-phosphate decarboxylase|nr:orotidine-5'-phosphate decarboxylase [Kangiellaceae bacterium]